MTMILCARVSWPVPAVRHERTNIERLVYGLHRPWWTCSWCGARVKVVA